MRAAMLMLCFSFAAAAVFAQPAPIPYQEVPFTLDSGRLTAPAAAPEEDAAAPVRVWRELVRSASAAWLRLFFRDVDLGPGGFIRIVSLADRAEQILDARALADWSNSSAFFNGDSVEIELHAPPGTDARAVVSRLWAGQRRQGPHIETICGTADDRVSWSDGGVGRVVPIGCTAWLISNGAILTAGHCNDTGFTTLQFQVPQSLCDGTTVNPPPDDQYPVVASSIVTQSGSASPGSDWMIFRVNPNSRGDNVFKRQTAYFRVTQTAYTVDAPLRVTGFGLDDDPRGCGGSQYNSNSQTEQSDSGPFKGQTGSGTNVQITYRVDTMGGNSGSPVIINGSRTTIGIHTNGGCTTTPTSANLGTGFANTALAGRMTTWNGLNVVYVDAETPEKTEDGTLFLPYRRVADAVATAPAGSTISIAGGSYDRVLTINKALTLIAPSGLVTLGADPTLP